MGQRELRYTKIIKVSPKAHRGLYAYKKLTGGHKKGYDYGWQIDHLIADEYSDLYELAIDAIEHMIKVSPEALKVLSAVAQRKGESPQEYIDRLLNKELGLVNWEKPSAKGEVK